MKTIAGLVALVAVLTLCVAPPAHAGASEDAALALGSFAVLNQLLRGETVLHDLFGGHRREVVRETVIVHQPSSHVVYVPPPPTVIYTPRAYYAPAPGYPYGHHFVPPRHFRHKNSGWHSHGRHHKTFKHKHKYDD